MQTGNIKSEVKDTFSAFVDDYYFYLVFFLGGGGDYNTVTKFLCFLPAKPYICLQIHGLFFSLIVIACIHVYVQAYIFIYISKHIYPVILLHISIYIYNIT